MRWARLGEKRLRITPLKKSFLSYCACSASPELRASLFLFSTPPRRIDAMADEEASIYDQIEIEDMSFDATLQLYTYPCPCGDRFEILLDDLRDGQEIAVCPSCSLMIQVIFEPEDLPVAPMETAKAVAVTA
ncbi:zf-CSL-domain-containing protein [Wilcoxina mikolae CBS 423.85]|nr:zf-CSL-domain-containing protein [Wilcoxina mikolae CBS 423.85]